MGSPTTEEAAGENAQNETSEESDTAKSESDIVSGKGDDDYKTDEDENDVKYVKSENSVKYIKEVKGPDFSIVDEISGHKSTPSHFDRSKAAISLLGAFNIRDKEGNDITAKFTSRLKNLLILLLLECERSEAGVKYQTIDEEIWNDKDEKSSKNNRNVSMRKLRVLLEEVGDIPIIYDKGFFKIDTSSVMFDYHEVYTRLQETGGGKSVTPEMVDEILELLLMGPLLPLTRYPWLDKYKADYSDSALTIMNKMLRRELGRDDTTAYRIAETITLHDPLSEEAMVAKCQILSRRKMFGRAKDVYQKFCTEYERSLGESYELSFADVCKTDLE